ncbi:3-methyladenine DNA glycosylase AlkD [Mariniphaga anaerophila]|uniref:3-methyladenine DNA glycosylase AlkD n=1 Tax=Mariniphaga anaerophila TaxID=1484053 RepID=A0A1M4SX87_9BACT|nr:DNA alkylation repair protein [Mariniphaga anaerophila]SHE36804.1 3-methyladenine DNA glycosylase AlkD [Mariniphaga anaerophila]
MTDIISEVRTQLRSSVDIKTKKNSQRFFKEKIDFYGVRVPVVKEISKKSFAKIKELDKTEIFGLIEILWKSGIIEESFVACEWTYALRKNFLPGDFKIFKNWIENYVNNWASCDTFCNHSMGTFIQMYPDFLDELKKFTESKNRWMRRASSVSLIVPARKGLFLNTIFEIADRLLADNDDLVQKGYGWMLKAASQAHQSEVFNYVMQNRLAIPRTSLRYAIEKMPPELKQKAMNKAG